MKEVNPEVAKAFSENQIFQILLNSLPKAYTSLADGLMTSHEATNEKLQKLMDKEDTLTKTESAMAAYRKTFKASCFLCDGAHLVAQCPYLSKAQAYIKDKVAKARSIRLLSRGSNQIRGSNWIEYTSPVEALTLGPRTSLFSIGQLAQGPLYQQPLDRFSSLLDP